MTETTQQEVQIEITQNGTYNNINPKNDLTDGQYIIVEKGEYDTAMIKEGKFGNYGIVSCIYQGVPVSFFITERDVQFWDKAGSTGDKVKVSAVANIDKKTGKPRFSPSTGKPLMYLNFEQAE